jgi:uncharacterized phosphosugar-binding protein
MTNTTITYFEKTAALLESLRKTQLPQIERAADLCADRISKGGLVFRFGNGHSRMMCEEMIPRQGCYPGFVALVELALSNHANIVGTNGLRAPLHLEKFEGYAEEILKGFKFGPHDAMIVVSTSGIRPVIVEMALGAKKRGLPVVGILSVAHCKQAAAGHSSGKKLLDVADIVIDNQCPPGDCIVELPGLEWRTGPTSTAPLLPGYERSSLPAQLEWSLRGLAFCSLGVFLHVLLRQRRHAATPLFVDHSAAALRP